MSREFDEALNDCLERIASGEGIQQCASRYPDHSRELVPLLRAATTTMGVAASPSYSPEARARGLSRLMQAATQSGQPKRHRLPFFRRPLAKPLVIGFAAVLLTALAAGGTTMASSNSVPGEPLYWVKTTKESLSLKMPRSDEAKARAHANLASERGKELRRLIVRGRMGDAELVVVRLRNHLNQSATYVGLRVTPPPVEVPIWPTRPGLSRGARELGASLERDGVALRAALSELIRGAPPGQQRRVRQLMDRSDRGYRLLIQALRIENSPQRSRFQ